MFRISKISLYVLISLGCFFFLFILLTGSCRKTSVKSDIPVVKNGVLDIRNWNFEKNGSLELKGEWEFYWGKFLSFNSFSSDSNMDVKYIKVPSHWNEIENNNQVYREFGFATYKLRIISKQKQKLEISIPEIMSSYKFWCNSNLIFSLGQTSNSGYNTRPKESPVMLDIDICKDTTVLIFQVSNFHHRIGGITVSPKIGNEAQIRHEFSIKQAFDLFLFGSILIIAFYHFGLFYMRKENPATLYFGIFALILGLRILFTGTKFITVLIPDINWFVKYRIEYLTLFLSPIFIVTFLYKIYRNEFNRNFTRIFALICILYALTVIFPPAFFTRLLLSFQIIILLVIVYLFIGLIKAVSHKLEGSKILFTSIIVFFISIINDILLNLGIISNTIELVSFGTFIFILGQSLVLAKILTGAFYENETLNMELDYQNRNLEGLVTIRTQELENQQMAVLKVNEELTHQNKEIQLINKNLEIQKLKLTESEAKFRELVELLPEAIFEIDSEGNFTYANDQFFKKLDYQFEEMNQLNMKKILLQSKDEQDPDFLLKIFKILFENRILKELECRIIKKDGSHFPILLSLSQTFETSKLSFRGIFIDISQRVENELKIQKAFNEIRKINKGITDSIRYALTIQNAILPSSGFIATLFDEFFIMNKPHSIVSGDFYYFEKHGKNIVFAIADCTGHGVPGGFMTMLGITQLHDIYRSNGLIEPDQALEIMRKQVIENLGQVFEENGSKDGMEMLLGIINTENLELNYASANIPFYILRNGQIDVHKGDRMPVGIYRKMVPFSKYKVQLKKDDILYLFTDGVVDLFGGEKERRLYEKGLQDMIFSCYTHELKEQQHLLEKALLNWQGDNKQTDDMLIIGLKI